MIDEQPTIFSRRDLLKGVGVAGAAAVTAPAGTLALSVVGAATETAQPAQAGQAAGSAAREVFENLAAVEGDILEAMLDRLIPNDELGPGAREARAARYIDRGLSGALAGSHEAYRAGLLALDNYARASRGKPFVELSPTDRDSVLIDVEFGAATAGMGFIGSAPAFFNMVKGHAWQGMFGDPYYGGNANFVGWDLIRYPGIRTVVSAAEQQRLERNELTPNHRSAYEGDFFNKATVRNESHEGHGDGAHGD